MPRSLRRWRPVLLSTLTALALVLPHGAAQAAPEPAPASVSASVSVKIHKALRSELSAGRATDFLVRLKEVTDLGAAAKAASKADKGAHVLAAKSAHADKSQAGLRTLLTSRKAEFTPFWIVNAVKVKGGSALADEIAALAEVESIEPDRELPRPTAAPGKELPKVNAVEWNIDRVNAPKAWNELGARGDGIVVANIDTGVQYDHPALVEKYRGRKADGTFDHNYNWNGSSECNPRTVPCDWDSHGTHTMGTMVGGVPTETIGVAPNAKWIAASVCDWEHCSDGELIAAGQWLLAPTDLTGRNPRPDLAPHVINNSWGGAPAQRWWYKPVLDAWIAAGIFPAFANGNRGPACATSDSPGDNIEAYSAGAFDTAGAIAPFSGRGASGDGQVKPNIAAPGVNVRSAGRNSGYYSSSGTSMASPHVAAAVALIWSAAPHIKGDVAATRELLDSTAIDVDDTSCGGTAANNNVWGEGRLDAFAAVREAPALNAGLRGTLRSGTEPVADAVVALAGPSKRKTTTKADGTYALTHVRPGTYQLTARKFGYDIANTTVTVTAGQTAVQDLTLALQPRHTVTGTVTDDSAPDSPVAVEAVDTPERTATDAAGRYRLSLPAGTYTLKVAPPAGRCSRATDVQVTVAGDTTKDIALPRRTDAFGYGCVRGKEPYVAGTTRLPLVGRAASTQVALPFAFPFYGEAHSTVWVGAGAALDFHGGRSWFNRPVPGPYRTPAVLPLWDDLVIDGQAGVYTAVLGTAPSRTFVVEWRDVAFHGHPTARVSVSALLGETGTISLRYRGVRDELAAGASATIGIESSDGTAFSFAHETPALTDGQSITFTSPHGVLTGTVTDANDGKPLAGARVAIGDSLTVTTGQDGAYITHVPIGDHRITMSKEHYGPLTRPATVTAGGHARLDAALITGRVSASLGETDLLTPANSTKSVTFVLTNLGGSAAPYTLHVEPVAAWLTATPAEGTLAPGASTTVTLTADSSGVPSGTYRKGTVKVRSASGRNPQIDIPVTLVIPSTRIAVDAGGTRDTVDSAGERWTADRPYTAGGHGYVSTRNRTHSTTATIKDTADQALFQQARAAMSEYRFDNLASGYYTVELGFAETRNSRPERRVFDVYAEGDLAVPALDLAQEVGVRTATVRQYTVKVTDGRLNIRFVSRTGTPIVSTVRVSDRPDRTTP
ncbi:Serine protease, subtilisin family [Sinosporangium album]|uniref:alpha-amylase n=1 Tax=Sinosporangium album TaxID=504805 RepID=A0A1G7QP76_9ACTN|nr:S8 family serine peptidase [Sinosporangium album]SDG00347.1 Serine protease, subtilisin family [Sinosporangium album]